MSELRNELIAEGVNPQTKAFKAREDLARAEAQTRYEKAQTVGQDPALRRSAELGRRGLSFVSTWFTVVVFTLGMAVAIPLMIFAEFLALADAFTVFEPETGKAVLYAASLILVYIFLLFVREALMKGHDESVREKQASLRHFADWLKYFVGFGKIDRYGEHHLGVELNIALRWLTRAILIGGFLGRIADRLAEIDAETWQGDLEALASSRLMDMLGFIFLPLTVAALLYGTHFAVKFIFDVFHKVGGTQLNFTSGGVTPKTLEEFEAEALDELYSDLLTKTRLRKTTTSPEP